MVSFQRFTPIEVSLPISYELFHPDGRLIAKGVLLGTTNKFGC